MAKEVIRGDRKESRKQKMRKSERKGEGRLVLERSKDPFQQWTMWWLFRRRSRSRLNTHPTTNKHITIKTQHS